MSSEAGSRSAVPVLDPSQGSAITNDMVFTVMPSGVITNRTPAWQHAMPMDSFTLGDVREQKLKIPATDYVDLSSIRIVGRIKCPVSATGDFSAPLHGAQAWIRSLKIENGGATIVNITNYNHAARHWYLARCTDEERNEGAVAEFMNADGDPIWATSFDKRYGTYNRYGETAADSGVGVEVAFSIKPFVPFLRKKKIWPVKYLGDLTLTIGWETDTKAIAERRFAWGHSTSGAAALNYTGVISEVRVQYHRCTLMTSLDESMLNQLRNKNGFSMSYPTLDTQLGSWGPNRTGTMVFDANHTNVHALFVYFQNNYITQNAVTSDLATANQYDYCTPGGTDVYASVGGVRMTPMRIGGATESAASDAITTTALLNARTRLTDSLDFWNAYVAAVNGMDVTDFKGQNNYESFHKGGLEAAADALTGVTGTGIASDTAENATSATFDTKFKGLYPIKIAYNTDGHTMLADGTNSSTPEIPRFKKLSNSFCIAVPCRTQADTLSGFSGLQSSRAINLVIQNATTRTNAINFQVRSVLEYTAVIQCRLGRVSVVS